MNAKLFSSAFLRSAFFSVILVLSVFKSYSQTLQFAQVGLTDTYKAQVNGLVPGDMVFYRFSDGFDKLVLSSSGNPTAFTERRFPPGGTVTVTAYIAKKSGPLGITASATVNLNGPACGDCIPPYVLSDNESVRLRYAWLPFSNSQSALTDNAFSPGLGFPAQPWLFLIVSLKPKTGQESAVITLPTGFTYHRAIYKNINGTNISQGDIGSITQPQSNKVKIQLNTESNNELNVYLILKIGQGAATSNLFSATFDDVRNGNMGTHNLTLEKRLYPHDPNLLYTDQKFICPGQMTATPVPYRVDFYNAGPGSADIVEVYVLFDPTVLDASTATLLEADPVCCTGPGAFSSMISSNSNLGFVAISLHNILLPGLHEHPKPTLEEASGYVVFEVTPRTCLVEPYSMAVNADVIFTAYPDFTEQTPTNSLVQHVMAVECPDPDIRCMNIGGGGSGGGTGGEGTGRSTEVPVSLTGEYFQPVCYPTPFSDVLRLEIPATIASETPVLVTITDMSGKKWMSMQRTVAPGGIFKEEVGTAQLPGGMYLVHFNNGMETVVRKVIKI